MTKEKAVKEIEKAFEPAFANYIITALTEGATVSDKEPTTKNNLGVDCINRQAAITFVCKNIKEILKDTTPLEVKLSDDYIYENVAKIMRNPKVLPSVTPQEPRWVPMVRREPTDEEKAEYLTQNGEELCYMLENKMPLNGQEVLVSSGGYVSEDVFDEDFYNFENNDIENVDAWMPLPQPYKAESEDE